MHGERSRPVPRSLWRLPRCSCILSLTVTDQFIPAPTPEGAPIPHRRRPRYAGKYPRRFEDKYKEHHPERYAETVAKVLAAGKTPAGTHRSIMVAEVLSVLAPRPGEIGVDCTLGYGGHAQELLARLQPGWEAAWPGRRSHRAPENRSPPAGARVRSGNLYRLPQQLRRAAHGCCPRPGSSGVDFILADLGVSSMQLDDPTRGFSLKHEGPLDMRMNPQRGQPASALLERSGADVLAALRGGKRGRTERPSARKCACRPPFRYDDCPGHGDPRHVAAPWQR